MDAGVAVQSATSRCRGRNLAFALIGRAGMPIGIGEVQSAEPLAAAGATAFREPLTRVIAAGHALTNLAPFRFFLRLLHTHFRRTRRAYIKTRPLAAALSS